MDFTPTELDILDAFYRQGTEVWLSLADEPDEERAELFSVSRGTLQRLQRFNPPLNTWHTRTPTCRRDWRIWSGICSGRCANHPAADAAGVEIIQAPGMLGEARLVARRIKTLLGQGTAAEEVLVSVREVLPYADLLREVFGDYGIPVDVEGTEPLTRNPAVALLLKALRLPEDDWPFAGLTALLRSGYFRPQWLETRFDADVPQLAEALLRLLGEPRGREAYLEAVRRWADRQQPGLEDEQAQESRRRRTHELAKKCGPFLERLFRAWDGMPQLAPLADHVAWMQTFAADLGLDRAALENAADVAAWRRFWDELDHWCRRGRGAGRWPAGARQASGLPHDRKTFLHRLGALAVEAGVARTPRGPGRVRVLSAPLARHHDAEYVFVMGLGERSFPRLAAPSALLDETERQALRQAGLDLPGVGDLLPAEMLLFYQLVTRPRRQLTLSYPAVDERGQDLLPSSFLNAVLDCFLPGAVPVQRRNMLIEGYDRDEPLSPAEHRVRTTVRAGTEATEAVFTGAGLSLDLASNLAAAAEVARCRFRHGDYTPYEGLFRNAAVIGELSHLFGPEKVFSPTALEDYVACPFRFFLGHVLRLEPLEEPSEEIEVTPVGRPSTAPCRVCTSNSGRPVCTSPPTRSTFTFWSASARPLPRTWLAPRRRLEGPVEAGRGAVAARGGALSRPVAGVRQAVGAAHRYAGAVFLRGGFRAACRGAAEGADGAEAVFCEPLVIRGGDIEVRISGRIDRVDVARLSEGVGFWIIDYKTGRTEHYTSKALAEFQRLQLTLYALAVEEVLLAGQQARPLGLAYWLVAGAGPKVALPTRNQVLWFNESERWRQVRRQLQDWVVTLVANIRGGVYPLKPRSETCTQTCQFSQVCRISQARSVDKSWSLPLPQLADAARPAAD